MRGRGGDGRGDDEAGVELIQRAVQTIADLGIASARDLQPHLTAWRQRPPSMDTQDDEQELATFLSGLFQANVITRNQGRTLLGMLTGSARPVPAAVAPPSQPHPDDAFIGRRFGSYIAEELVGEGAMGRVYRATREGTLERDFVIKVFGSKDEEAVRRFGREAEIMGSLDHPNIVKVVASGQEGSVPYMVLEYVDGPTLQEMLKERGRFSWKSATRAVKQIAMALIEAHGKGIVHRDLKPANVLVARGGMLRLFDFGLAKVTTHSSLSAAGDILGSPAFIAPEQWGDHEVDARADLFALGVIYYLLMAGKPPFRGRTPSDYSAAIQAGSYTPLAEVAPDADSRVCHLVTALLETERAYRPISAKAVVQDLDRILRGKHPNLPRIEPRGGQEPFPLVGKDIFRVGSDPSCEVLIGGASAAHATIARTPAGYLLKSVVRAEDTRVNGNPVDEIVLRDKDKVEFGDSEVHRFRTGHVGQGGRYASISERLNKSEMVSAEVTQDAGEPPLPVPGLLDAALASSAHPRSFVSCFEQMDARLRERTFERTRRALFSTGLQEPAAAALERARELARQRTWDLAEKLFDRSRENLGREVEAWLSWWIEARATHPRQFRGPGERAFGWIELEGEGSHRIELRERESWTLGRADEADITIPERSVSRTHLQLIRLNRRILFRDLGSRFGVRREDERVEIGLLGDGDELELGKVKLTFRDGLEQEPLVTSPMIEVDPLTFEALVEQSPQHAIVILVRLLDTAPLADFCIQGAAPHEDFASIGSLVMDFLDHQRSRALSVLPKVTGVDHGQDSAAWAAWLDQAAPTLPPQVVPAGWTR